MPSLREHLGRVPDVRARNLGAWMAPAFGERAVPVSPRVLEEAALSVFAHVVAHSGPIREQLTSERRHFARLVDQVHRLPSAPRSQDGGGD